MFRWIDQTHQRHRLLAGSLLALQAALLTGPAADEHSTFVLIHFALVLLWQPFWQGSTRVNPGTAIATIAVGVAVIYWSSWALLSVWLLILLGLIGGEQTQARRDQLIQWLVVIYLLLALFFGVVPRLFALPVEAADTLDQLLVAATVIPLIALFVRAGPTGTTLQRFDYLRSLGITLLALMLAAGSVLWTYRSGTDYPLALIQSLLFVGVLILTVNWLWKRRASHSMLQVLWNRYLLNLGTPFEHYLISLSGASAQGLDPDSYLDRSLAAMQDIDWIVGVEARGSAGERLVGERTAHATEAYDEIIPLIVYTRNEPGPALRLHTQLLAQLVQQFYKLHLHEAELRNQEKARIVHETGARLTHDIKNLLQSLQSLGAAVESTPDERSREAMDLVKRQLPYINQRLQATIEKLRDPAEANSRDRVGLAQWWQSIQARYPEANIRFEGEAPQGVTVPQELFDTVAENLLENARYKQAEDENLQIRVELTSDAGQVALQVSDSGRPMPEQVARYLFGGAVPSASGLGVGLYQCGRLAEFHGFRLRLEENREGAVRFRLSGPVQGA
ncbi:MAG: HAMP domain-containing sensor histidine kinase [Halofilum sp. (in: g-proteobacteria)]|nr:HAMP domain-containing sensor histidine kinase [Halofilum sp. (in: g-proteobacteria)]